MKTLVAAYNLLRELGINQVMCCKFEFRIQYDLPNQQIIAFGHTEQEVVENFYDLYNEFKNPV